jgi:hypothetical protein
VDLLRRQLEPLGAFAGAFVVQAFESEQEKDESDSPDSEPLGARALG